MRAAVTLLAAATVVTHAEVASAAPFELEWSAPEGCPSREQIVEASLARLGENKSSDPPELFVRGNVDIEDGAYVAHFQVKDAAGADLGERRVRFDEPRCEDITDSAALVLAMMIAVARPHTLAPETEAPRASTPRRARARPAPVVASRSFAHVPMTVGASAVVSMGLLPNVGFGGALRWTATFSPPILLGLEGSFEASPVAHVAGGETTFRYLDAGALVGFRVVRWPGLEIVALFEARGGMAIASTAGFRSAYDATRFVGIVAAGVLGRVPLGPTLRLEVLPDLRVPIVVPDFVVRERGELVRVHRPAPVEGRLSLGIAWEFL
jgi:hypothetical protein